MPQTNARTVTVNIPTALRPQIDDQETVEARGETVGEALGGLSEKHPEFGRRLYQGGDASGDGQLNRFINVYVNDEDIRFLDNLKTPLKPGDEVSIVPAIAGG